MFSFPRTNASIFVKVAHKSLAYVKLTQAAKIRVGSYIGEMKHCLSVAITLIGDPKLVILMNWCVK